MKLYFIKTFGCQMNVADSERMAGVLEARGLKPAAGPCEADVILVNTCTIRRKAEDKAVSELGRCLRLKRANGFPIVAAAGCVARKEGKSLMKRLPGLDIVLGHNRIARLGDLLDRCLEGRRPVMDIDDLPAGAAPGAPVREKGVSAFVTIMHGCDNHCSYCVVPAVRGPEISRPAAAIVEEVTRLAEAGFREVTLLGQNVNSYGKGLHPPCDFPDLLEMLDRRSGIERLRFTTSHPKDFSRELAWAVRDLPSVCEAVHLPVQAGSDKILAAMNRGYTAAEYREKAAFLRETVPDVALSTDIIVGYPAEEGIDFDETVRLVSETAYSSLFAFKFSSRPGTPGSLVTDNVPATEKDRRLQSILELQSGITRALHLEMVGRSFEVLIEGPSKMDARMMSGRTRGNQVVNFQGGGVPAGARVTVLITEAGNHSLRGNLKR